MHKELINAFYALDSLYIDSFVSTQDLILKPIVWFVDKKHSVFCSSFNFAATKSQFALSCCSWMNNLKRKEIQAVD